MENFKIIQQIAEGQYGSVFKAINNQTQETVAIKKLKDICTFQMGISLREVMALKKLNHPNILKLITVFEHEDHFNIVFEYVERNLVQVIKHIKTEGKIRSIVFQILQGLDYLHKKGYFHRDLKPENILISDNQVKICDFGLVREIHSNPPYTEYVGTRWYRAPEILLSKPYNYQVDIFALGCIMAELYLKKPLVAGSSQMEQLQKLEKLLIQDFQGLDIPSASPMALDLMHQMLRWEPQKRPSASELMSHPFFKDPDSSPLPMLKKSTIRNNNPFKLVKTQQQQQQQQQQRLPTLMRRFNN